MLRSSLLKAADATERTIDGFKFGLKWRYGLWRHLSIRPYRGYGQRSGSLHLRGRVLDDRRTKKPSPDQPAWRNAINTLRRISSDEIPGARVRLHLGEQTLSATTDEDGFFTFDFEPEAPLPPDRVWHDVRLVLEAPSPNTDGTDTDDTETTGHIIIPREEAEFAVVSDLDDTVIHTGATDKLQMARVVLLNNASTRAPFPGIGAFYGALQDGPDAAGHNPIFYVSGSPWNLYDMFQAFFEAYDLPVGPMFLKDFGLTEKRFFKPGNAEYKRSRIERLFETYPDLPFILIGDSGQKDPEVYRRLVGDHEERIQAVFIRDVTTPERDDEVHAIARQVERMGVPMFLVEDTAEAAAHAADLGIITEEAAGTVREHMQREEEAKEDTSGGLKERLLGARDKTRSVFKS